MAGERQLVPLRANPQRIEYELTAGLGYESSALRPKGAENYVSMEIHLGEMERATRGLIDQEAIDLRDLILWRRSIATVGVEDNVRFFSLNSLNASLENYRVNRARLERERTKRQVATASSQTAEASRFNRALTTGARVGAGAVATVALAALSGFLWVDHVHERSAAFDQRDAAVSQLKAIEPQYKSATDEEKQKILEVAQPVVNSGQEATAKIVDIDEWNSIGTAAKGFGLVFMPFATVGAGMITVDSAKKRR